MATNVQPLTVPQAIAQALQAHRVGRLEDAEAIYRQVLASVPDHPDALHLLGVIAHQRGDHIHARQLIDRAIAINAKESAYYSNRGMVRRAVGDHAGAIVDFRQAIALDPYLADAHFNLGIVLHERGQITEALACYQQALSCGHDTAELRTQLGQALRSRGELTDAIASYHRALLFAPEYAPAFMGLAAALRTLDGQQAHAAFAQQCANRLRRGETLEHSALAAFFFGQARFFETHKNHDLELICLERALALRPDWAAVLNDLGLEFNRRGEHGKAIDVYRRAIEIDPDFVEAHNNLGLAMQNLGNVEDAILSLRRAAALAPDRVSIHENLGYMFLQDGRPDEAEKALRRAYDLQPDNPKRCADIGQALLDQYRFREAISQFIRAVAMDSCDYHLHMHLGVAYLYARAFDDAIATFRHTIALSPTEPLGHVNLAIGLLATAQFEEGWKEYEWRLTQLKLPFADKTRWHGEELSSKSILLVCEQGLGDCIQFVRYVTLLAERGASVFVAAPPALTRLFETVNGIAGVFSSTNQAPTCDFQSPLLSLPLAFATNLASIPVSTPYIKPELQLVMRWKEKLKDYEGSVKIGLAWAGSATLNGDYRRGWRRNIPSAALTPLAAVPNATFVSLQKEVQAKSQMRLPDSVFPMIDYTADLSDFADTAALIENLDLIISADTAVAHLAGAMGKPVWLLPRFEGEWRWLPLRTRSPWYPTMEIFWQNSPGAWNEPIAKITHALRSRNLSFWRDSRS